MEGGLTPRQRSILEFIRREVVTRGYPPSVREIGDAVGLSSSSTVHGHLARLEEKGFIRRDPSKPRAIEVVQPPVRPGGRRVVEVPVVGRIAAGQPILAVENIEDTFPLPWDFVRGQSVFLLEVKGDSMAGAGILDGDLVLVRQQQQAESGDIVAALVGDEAAVKRFFREAGRVRLQSENPLYPPLYARDVRILGRVIGLIRRMV